MFKFMKKVIAVMTMGAMLIAPSTVFAAETNQDTTKDTIAETTEATTRDSSSFTMELKHNMASVVQLRYMGFNPTVKVRATGNANMTYKVWVVNPVGIKGDVGYVRGDGSTIEKNLFLSVGGDYYIYVQPWSGTTNGQSSYFDFTITW